MQFFSSWLELFLVQSDLLRVVTIVSCNENITERDPTKKVLIVNSNPLFPSPLPLPFLSEIRRGFLELLLLFWKRRKNWLSRKIKTVFYAFEFGRASLFKKILVKQD